MSILNYLDFKRVFRVLTEEKAKPTFASILPDLESRESLVELAEVIGLSNTDLVPEPELHITVAYSRADIMDPTKIIKAALPVFGAGDEFTIFNTRDGKRALVLKVSSVSIRALHVALRKHGASHDFPTYEPHVTLCYDLPEGFVMPKNAPFVNLAFTSFEVKPLNLDWKPSNK